jgi:prepilin-type N-terminal cleavage/methylation domain-containing protein
VNRKGFTLVEVLVALLILALLSGAVYQFMSSIAEDRARIETVVNRNIGATRLFTLIETDLLTCVAQSDDGAPGVKGDSSSLRIARRAVKLSFEKAADFTDATTTEYRFNTSSKAMVAGRDGRSAEELISNVALVRFRFFHEGEWSDSFDSSASGTVPAAVEIAVWFAGTGTANDSEDSDDDVRLPSPDRIRVIGIHDAVVLGGTAP